jgi:16S rRNA G966 N2-methylase RsmD
MPNKKNKRGRPIPLASLNECRPMTSRKRARKVTTMFHKLTSQRDVALQDGDTKLVKSLEENLEEMGVENAVYTCNVKESESQLLCTSITFLLLNHSA